MEEYGIPREEIFVITKIYPNQFSDPEPRSTWHWKNWTSAILT